MTEISTATEADLGHHLEDHQAHRQWSNSATRGPYPVHILGLVPRTKEGQRQAIDHPGPRPGGAPSTTWTICRTQVASSHIHAPAVDAPGPTLWLADRIGRVALRSWYTKLGSRPTSTR